MILILFVPSIGVLITLFFFAERVVALKLPSSAAAAARASREETHRALTQAILELLEGMGVGEWSSLVEHLGMVSGVACEWGVAMARQLVHQVVAMFLSHYPDLDHELLGEGWPPGYEDH
jgi:hypothetical protein